MSFRRRLGTRITTPIVPFLSRIGLTPDALTWIGLFIILAAAILIAKGHLLIGGILVLFSGLFDILDGALARYKQKTSKFGAILDSTFDRISEAVVLLALIFLYTRQGDTWIACLCAFVIVVSFLISYIKARAEGLGLDCEVGIFTRAERVLVMAAGLIFNLVLIALVILAVFSLVTVVQRLLHVYKSGRNPQN